MLNNGLLFFSAMGEEWVKLLRGCLLWKKNKMHGLPFGCNINEWNVIEEYRDFLQVDHYN